MARVGRKLHLLEGAWHCVRSATELPAVDPHGLPRITVVDHRELAGDRAAVRFGVEAELLARDFLGRSHGLEIRHDLVGLVLRIEATVSPVLADVVCLALGREVVDFGEIAAQRHHLQRLRERARRLDRESSLLDLRPDIEIPPLWIVGDVGQPPGGYSELRQLPLLHLRQHSAA